MWVGGKLKGFFFVCIIWFSGGVERDSLKLNESFKIVIGGTYVHCEWFMRQSVPQSVAQFLVLVGAGLRFPLAHLRASAAFPHPAL